MAKVVIVESPAKAKTISRFLGSGYDVLASFGHIRDLPESASDIPADYKKEKWAKLGVNTEKNFEPLYIVPDDKKRHVDALKKASKGATEILLATDEDREGESISWHILQILKPGKSVSVKRIVFHEITPEAIKEALASPRTVDENLVRAQETRRILDRLYGYTLSPLLWKKVAPKLSAGRVQSVATRLIVERERERMAFVSASYWDLLAEVGAGKEKFPARLTKIDQEKIATGKSFDDHTGKLKEKARLLDEAAALALAEQSLNTKPWHITSVVTTPGQENPPAPFMTSTLQQEANRKLRLSSKRTMQIAQGLYEGVDLGGERTGLITYMRTDSLNLAERALAEARVVIGDLYGKEYLPAKPVRYKTKSKGAQEAHEAIRPTDLSRRPQDVAKYLDKDQLALYELIWKRTIASQMLPAKVNRTSVDMEVKTPGGLLEFHSTGKQIVFPGFLRAYVEGSDDPEAELDQRESLLPPLKEGQAVEPQKVEAQGHATKPPARYTEASLVKKLEEAGVGRPSTYASIIGTIQDRGYVNKKGNELVPTFTAFAVTELLEDHFLELVDTDFTAKMENELDDIADGKLDHVSHLREFYTGTQDHPGIAPQVTLKEGDIAYPSLELGKTEDGEPVVIRVGRYGPFVQRGEGGAGNTANISGDLAPAEVNLELALKLIALKASGPEPVAKEPGTGLNVYYRTGRFGDYLEIEQTEDEKSKDQKPRRVTLPKDVKIEELSEDDLGLLLQFPRTLGQHPELKEPVTVQIGQYGPYVRVGKEIRNVENWRTAGALTFEEALAILAQPRTRRGAAAKIEIEPIKEFGPLEGAQGPVKVLPGRYGPYVSDGKTNATIPKGTDPEEITAEEAIALLKERAAAGPTKKKKFVRRKTTARK